MEKMDMRFVKITDIVYLRAEDVVAMVRSIAGSEETDVRNRLEQFATNLSKVNKPNDRTPTSGN